MGLFDKKFCSVCGGKIGLLGNRKLADGNLCKDCAAKLSPWFSERRQSSVEEIKDQLAYREANREELAAFHVTRSYGTGMKLLVDEDARKFVVTRARDLTEANPDVIDYAQVTGVDLDINESHSEVKTKDREGKPVSFNPPRYTFSENFYIVIHVNHPYFDTIRFQLNSSSVVLNPDNPAPMVRKPSPMLSREYKEYEAMGKEIQKALTEARKAVRQEAAAAAAPKKAKTCPWCGATSIPDVNGCCEYCGGSLDA